MTEAEKPACPFCGERVRIELVSPTGSQLITAQWRCQRCVSYFEAIRADFAQA
jgi:hypothetical protein